MVLRAAVAMRSPLVDFLARFLVLLHLQLLIRRPLLGCEYHSDLLLGRDREVPDRLSFCCGDGWMSTQGRMVRGFRIKRQWFQNVGSALEPELLKTSRFRSENRDQLGRLVVGQVEFGLEHFTAIFRTRSAVAALCVQGRGGGDSQGEEQGRAPREVQVHRLILTFLPAPAFCAEMRRGRAGAKPIGCARQRGIVPRGLRCRQRGRGAGLVCALLMTRLMSSLLYGVSSTDPVIFLGGAVLVTLVATVACYLPARRAVRVEPLAALRSE